MSDSSEASSRRERGYAGSGAPALARSRQRGASTVELLIIIGVVALSALAAFSLFGDAIREVVGFQSDCVRTLSGQCASGPFGDATGGETGEVNPVIHVTGETTVHWSEAETAAGLPQAFALITIPPDADERVMTGAIQVARGLSQLPPAHLQLLLDQGYRYEIYPDNIAAGIPERYRNQSPRGYPPGSTWEDVLGAQLGDERRILLSVDANGNIQNAGSDDVVDHETAHALDHATNRRPWWAFWQTEQAASLTAEFQSAYDADFGTGNTNNPYAAGGPLGNPYFHIDDPASVVQGSQTTRQGVLSETYAEAYTMYLNERANPGALVATDRHPVSGSVVPTFPNLYPQLYEYFRSRDPGG